RAPSVEHLTALVASVWQEHLDVPEVTADDDFFVLGGHSMLVARVLYRLRDLLNADLPLRALFDHTTVRGFAEEIERDRVEIARAGGINPKVRTCGGGLLAEPTTVVVLQRADPAAGRTRKRR
ncbi:phosphopantetheine-binding protein, partial [Kibdelosporangium lantanae]